jgi:hypothetical protein
VIATLGLDSALARTAYNFTMQASDPDSDQVMWYLLRAPDSMRINVVTGLISWTPQDADIGVDTVVVRATDGVKSDTAQYLIKVNGSVTAERARPMPVTLTLSAAPNPFNPDVELSVAVPLSEKAGLTVMIFDVRGRVLSSWAIRSAGYHDFQWSGKDASGRPLPTGLYIARLSGGSRVLQKKLLLIK